MSEAVSHGLVHPSRTNRPSLPGALRFPAAALVGLLALHSAGCQWRQEPAPEAPRTVRTLASYEVRGGGRELGTLIEMVIEDPRGPVKMWRVENSDRQFLGFADAQGRFYQRVPFSDRERFLGIYPMESGLALLYETEAKITIQAHEAVLRKSAR